MKDRILFWCDRQFITFGIANSLQKQYDCDLYAIFQLADRTKDIFRKQQIVKFKQSWIFNDYVSKEKQNPDLKYLASFEEKYSINLWKIPYTDFRISFNNYHKFTRNEILSLFTQECKFFEDVLDKVKPHFLIIRSYDDHDTRILYELCKARGIKILMLVTTRFNLRYKISGEEDDVDDYTKNNSNSGETSDTLQINLEQLSADSNKRYDRIDVHRKANVWSDIKQGVSVLLFANNDKYLFLNRGRNKPKVIFSFLSSFLKKKYRAFFIDRNCTREINQDEKFIYFPLHFEPERLLFVQVPFKTNQLEVIKNIAKSLPIDYKLYVKEHPAMKVKNWRETSYYKQIMDLPNVRLVHTSVNYKELLEKCSLVISIAGSSSLEAAFYNKPSIVMAGVSYASIPSIYRVNNYEELSHAIRKSLRTKVNSSDLKEYINFIYKNSFEFEPLDPFLEVDMFYKKGFFLNNPLSTENIKACLERNKEVFDLLALKHIEKINEIKNMNLENSQATNEII